MIKINGNYTITFVGEYVKFEGRTFKIKNLDSINKLRILYESMDYTEKEWGK